MDIQTAFSNIKLTENGDLAFKSTGDNYVDLVFFAEYLNKHPQDARIDDSDKAKLLAMFIRDPRFGMGYRDLGRMLMAKAGVSAEDTVLAGRFDDLFFPIVRGLDYIKKEIDNGNALAKKWMPRFGSKNKKLASLLASLLNMNKQEYGKYIKVETTESLLAEQRTSDIKFEQVPSKAILKYWKRFQNGKDTCFRFIQYAEDVKAGTKELHVSTTNVYDIFKNRAVIDPDLFFDKIQKISVSCLPIVDTSGSMYDVHDSIGKAIAIGHYLGKCNTYMPGRVLSFSSHPQLIKLGATSNSEFGDNKSQYMKEVNSMYTGDCSNTDFGAVLNVLKMCDMKQFPDYFVVLSDMEFDRGSNQSLVELEQLFRENNCNTKIVWWNLNSRQKTAPEMDANGNIFLSGYNPMLLSYLSAGFNNQRFIDVLIEQYGRKVFGDADAPK